MLKFINIMAKNTIKEFLVSGKKTEEKFSELFDKTLKSTKYQDINEHWDVLINYKIDVKGLKKIKRSDDNVNENIHWVEIKNVNGNLGWLYAEETDFFAFELFKYWIIVEKIKLQKFISNNVVKEYVNEPMLYKLYRRIGRNDVITLVNSFDLVYISEKLISKNNN